MSTVSLIDPGVREAALAAALASLPLPPGYTGIGVTPPPPDIQHTIPPQVAAAAAAGGSGGRAIPSAEHRDVDPTTLPVVAAAAAAAGGYAMPKLSLTKLITEEEARAALERLVKEKVLWGSKALRALQIVGIRPHPMHVLTVASLLEARATRWLFAPYSGGPVDAGIVPLPWSVDVKPQTPWKNHMAETDIPKSSRILDCFICKTQGQIWCRNCGQAGYLKCNSCGQKGEILEPPRKVGEKATHRKCPDCKGQGSIRCEVCRGTGFNTCPECKGEKRLRAYLRLYVRWTVHEETRVLGGADVQLPQFPVPITAMLGESLCQQEAYRVGPIGRCDEEPSVCVASAEMLTAQLLAVPHERVVLQRQTLVRVPISEVTAQYQDTRFRYWVYGLHNEAFAPEYPTKLCALL